MGWKEIGVDGRGQTGQAFQQVGGGRVEVLVGNAIDSALADGGEMMPFALLDDSGEGNSVTRSTPCEEENIGAGPGDFFCRGVAAGFA